MFGTFLVWVTDQEIDHTNRTEVKGKAKRQEIREAWEIFVADAQNCLEAE
jgi:hypothetical protein